MTMNYYDYKSKKILTYVDSVGKGWRIFPASLQIAITDLCYNKCITCGHWQRENKKELKYQDLLQFLGVGLKMGLETVCYSGGDPFAYRNINQIVDWHITNEVEYGFVTSGFIPNWVEDYTIKNAQWIRVSLDAVGDMNYELCRGGVAWPKVHSSIERIVKIGANVEFGITVHRHNIDNILDIFDYAASLGIQKVMIWSVRKPGVGEIDLRANGAQIKNLIETSKHYSKSFPCSNINDAADILMFGDKFYKFKRCMTPLVHAFIGANGMVYPCCTMAGDTKDSAQGAGFGYITEPWETIYENILTWSKREYYELPEFCHTNCVPRIAITNQVLSNEIGRRHFI